MKIKSIIAKKSNLFSEWKDEKFEMIVCTVSQISEEVAPISPWFNVTDCDTGKGGDKLINEVIENIGKYASERMLRQICLRKCASENINRKICCGKCAYENMLGGMHILESNSSKKDIVGALKLLNTRCSNFFRKRSSTRIMAVEYISTHDPDKLIDLYRVHICLGKIISYYAVTSKLNVFHSIDMNYEDLNRFILINENLPSKISKIESKILLSAKVLGCNVGAVEFFLINDEPVFLEFNPMWGGNASKLGFGPKKFRNHLEKNRSSLESRIPNIYQFTDYQLYYKSLYKGIHDYYQNNSTS